MNLRNVDDLIHVKDLKNLTDLTNMTDTTNLRNLTCIKDLINFTNLENWNVDKSIDLTFITHSQDSSKWCISKMVVTHFFIFDPSVRDTKAFIVY